MYYGTLTLRNYRCFDWNNPMQIELRQGFTAIVGPNNSGKSTALKSIFELRQLLSSLSGPLHPNHRNSFNGQLYQGYADVSELANDNDPSRFHVSLDLPIPKAFDNSALEVLSATIECNLTTQRISVIKVVAIGQDGEHYTMETDALSTPKSIAPEFIVSYANGYVVDYRRLIAFGALLGESRYFPAFRNAINEGGAQYYDIPVGTSIVAAWDNWKAGNNRMQKIAISKVEHEIASLLGFRSLQINADQTSKTLDVIINGRPHKLYEVGAGVAQLIITLSAALVSKPPFLFIDEPELNLHPSLQLQFLTALASYVDKGITYATHSIGLARSTAERIYCVSKSPDQPSRMQKFGDHQPNFAEWLGELSYSSRLELGCEGLLLVEGPSEVLCFQEFLRKIKKDHRFVLMQLGGSSLINEKIEPHLAEITRIIEPKNIHVYIDSEREANGASLAIDRQGFLEKCKAFGIYACASDRRATENYFSEKGITKALGPGYQALSPFQRLKDAAKPWHKSSNWKIAREMSFDEIENTDLGKFLATI